MRLFEIELDRLEIGDGLFFDVEKDEIVGPRNPETYAGLTLRALNAVKRARENGVKERAKQEALLTVQYRVRPKAKRKRSS